MTYMIAKKTIGPAYENKISFCHVVHDGSRRGVLIGFPTLPPVYAVVQFRGKARSYLGGLIRRGNAQFQR